MIFFDRPDFSPAFVSQENCFNVAKNSFDRSKKLTKHGGRSKIWGCSSNRRSFKKKGFASINAKDWGIIVYDPSHCFELGPILKTEKPKRPILSSHYHNQATPQFKEKKSIVTDQVFQQDCPILGSPGKIQEQDRTTQLVRTLLFFKSIWMPSWGSQGCK